MKGKPVQVNSKTKRRARRRGKRPTIGVLVSQITHKNDRSMWQGVVDAAKKRDVNVVCFVGLWLHSPYGFEAQANVIYDLVSAEKLDGLVIMAGAISQFDRPEEKSAFIERYRPLPIVTLDGEVPGTPNIYVDSFQNMRKAVLHLIQVHNYRRIAFIRGPEKMRVANERHRAYVETLAEYGLPLDPALVTLPLNWYDGRQGLSWLLDHQVDFEAVIGANDDLAMGAIEELRARGIRVPEEVAVVGYDDAAQSRWIIPPLTTVPIETYEWGQQALEMVLDLIEGKPVPEQVVIPTELMVRQSCGCIDPVVVQATVEPAVPLPKGSHERMSLEAVVPGRQEDILAEIRQAAGKEALSIEPGQIAQLWDAFIAELNRTSSGIFLRTLDQILRQTIATGGEIEGWDQVISVLRRQALPCLYDSETLLRAENLWQQARVLIGKAVQRMQGYREVLSEQRMSVLREIGSALITTFNIEGLTDVLARQLPGLDIPSAYLALYEDPKQPTGPARLLLAYNEQGRIEIEAGGQVFPASQLVPQGLLPQERRYSMVVEPLYFREDQLGFVLFEADPREGAMYEALRGEISSALQGALLVRQAERRSAQLQTAAEVSRAASSILAPDELIRQAVELIRGRFGLYYAGLFLVDESGKWAVLQAGTGEAGQKMLEQGHRLEVGGASMIGWCVANKQARVALDTGAEAVRFENPLLSQTRSELALPLVSRGEAIGALTIQSAEEAAFSEEDIAVLQTMADQLANAIANTRLFEQAQARTAELAVLDEMARALTATLDVGTMLENVYHHTSRLMDTSNLYVAMYDAQKDEVSFPFYRVGGKPIAQVESRRAGKGLTEHVLRTCQPFLVEENIATQLKELGIEMIGREAQSWLGAPMVTGDQVIGVLAVQSYTTPRVYNKHHRDLLSAIANQTAIAVQNARLFEQAQIRAAELTVLNELGQALAARLSMNEVLDEVYRGASRLMDATNFYVALYDPDKDEITFPLDVTPEEEDRFRTLSTDEGLTGYIVRNRTGVLIQENLPERLAQIGVKMVGQPALSWLGVPMMVGDRVLGVLGVQSYTAPRAYDEHDRDLLTALASQTAIAIQNARLFERTQAALQESEATYRRYLQQAWAEYRQTVRQPGYEVGRPGSTPLGDAVLPEVRQVMEQRRTIVSAGDGGGGEEHSALVVPVAIRGTVIGALGIHATDEARLWTEDEIAVAEAVAERMALAAENLRLLDETQRRATQEQLLGQISDRMQRSANLEALMHLAAEELNKALGGSRVFVRMGTAAELTGKDEK